MPDESPNSFSRRDFLGLGAAAAALGGLAPTHGQAQPNAMRDTPEALERRRTGRFGDTEPSATLTAQLEALDAGRTTSAALVDAALGRIVAMDRQGPRLQAMLDLNPEARAIAAERDAERQAGRLRGSLHGVPIVIKDNIDTGDQMSTTAGSLALADTFAGTDATVAAKLRAAGAVLLGKTNLSEWANFRSTRSSSGWSARGGQTRNPYALDRSPSGSSSGSGSAIAAGYAGGAIGTETDGSIVSPAAANGLVGVKPTVGLVSRAGIIPISHTQDTAGPMTTTVRDAALLLGAIAGSDARDAATLRRSAPAVDYVAALRSDALRGVRIGVSRKGFFGFHTETDAVAESALQALRDAGAVLVDPAEIVTAQAFGEAEFDVLLFEFKAGLEAYLARRGPDVAVRTLADLQAFNERERARELPWFGQEIVELALKKGPLTSPAYRKALAHCRLKAQREGLDATFARHRVEAVVMPTQGPAWVIDLIKGDAFGGGGASSVPAVAGYPHVTVPMGQVHGLPVGLSFVGPAWSEARLLAFAFAFEQATAARRTPTYAPSTLQMLGV
jgi:amidase